MAIKFLSGASIPNIASGSILKVDANGNIVAAVSGTDYDTAAGQWTGANGGIYYSDNVRIGTYSTSVAPSAKLHVFDYQTTDPKLLIEDGNTGDASMEFKISTQSYTMGIDNSDADKFVFAASTALGTTNVLEISTGGLSAFQEQVLFNKPVSVLGTYGHWRVNGYGGMYFNNDSDANNTRYIHPRSNGALSIGRGLTSALTGSAPDNYFGTNYDQFYINGAGLVGIGTSDPTAKLDVRGSLYLEQSLGDNTFITLSNKNTAGDIVNQKSFIDFTFTDSNTNETPQVRIGAHVGNNDGDASSQGEEGMGAFVVHTNDANTDAGAAGTSLTERFRVDRLGNVGIGTTAPYAKLVVGSRGTAAATSILAYDGIAFDFYNDGSPYKRHGVIISQAGDASESVLDFNTKAASGTNSTKMTILGNGNVGIGTATPGAKLHVNSENAEGTLLLSRGGNNMVSGQGVGSIVFPADYNGTPTNYGKIVSYANALSAVRGSLDFKVKSTSGSLLTGMTVYGTSAGVNVGIGTTDPSEKLEVVGIIESTTNGNRVKGNISLGIKTNNSAKWHSITGTQYGYTAEPEGYSLINGASGDGVNAVNMGGGLNEQNAATQVSLWTAANVSTRTGTERMRIASDGTITFHAYGAGFLKTNASGVVSVDTNTYSTASGVEDNADVTDATNVAAAGALMKAGGTMTGNVIFPAEEANSFKIAFTGASASSGLSTVDQSGAGLYIGANSRVNNSGNVVFHDTLLPSSGIYFDGWSGDDMEFYTGASGNPTKRLTISSTGDATFTGALTADGKLYIGTIDATSTAVTALLLGAAGEVKKRALGSNAFSSTSYLSLAGGTLTGQVIFPSASTTKPVLPNGYIARNDNSDTDGTHDIWGISERYYPSNETDADAWGIQWSGTPNEINFIGAGQKKLSIDLDTDGTVKIDGNAVATESYVGTAISNLVDSSPAALNTLNELAAALGDDASFSTTVATSIGTKLPLAGGTLTGDLRVTNGDNNGIRFHSDGANITSVSSGDIVIQRLTAGLRFGSSSGWDYNHWAGIKFDSNVLYIGGPAASQFTSNAAPPTIDVNFVGVGSIKVGGSNTITDTKIGQWDTAYGWGDHGLSAQDKTDIAALSGTNTGDQTLPTASSLGAVTLTGTQTISGNKTFSGSQNHYKGHLYYDSYDSAGNHYFHFNDGAAVGGTTVNWRQYYGTQLKTHTWTSDSSGNMVFTFQGDIDANGGDITADNFSGSSSGTNTGDQTLSSLGGAAASTAALKTFDSTANLASPSASNGTWTTGSTADWGTPRIGSSVARFNDGTGSIDFAVPTGIKTAYISQLTWDSGGYMDVYGVQTDGDEVFLRRINTENNVENINHSNPNQHDGSTIAFAGHVGDFPTIRLHNKSGRFHLTGLGWSKSELGASDGTGLVHPNQLSIPLPYSSLSGTPTLGTAAATASTAYATSAQGTLATNALPKAGGTMTGILTLSHNNAVPLNITGANSGYTAIAVKNTGTGNAGVYYDAINGDLAGSDYGFIGQNNAGHMLYDIGASSPAPYHVFTGGNVGIGNAAPYSLLQVGDPEQTTAAVLTIASRYGGTAPVLNFRSGHPTTTAVWDMARITGTDDGNFNGRLEFRTSNSSEAAPTIKMVVKATGNVGIGNNDPTAKLQVGPGTSSASKSGVASLGGASDSLLSTLSLVNTSGNNTLGNGVALDFHLAENYSPTGRVATVAESTTVHAGLAFYTYQGGLTEKMRISNTGDVGIGTDAPSARLHLHDTTEEVLRIDSGTSGAIHFFENTTRRGILGYSNGTGITGDADAGDMVLRAESGKKLHFCTNGGTARMTVDSAGKVGIGTVSPAAPLHVAVATDYKVIKLADDVTSHYKITGLANHTLSLTCGSYYQAEVVITANQTNGGANNNLYLRGIWSNNHTSHNWDVLEEIGGLTSSSFAITNSQNGSTTASGKLEVVHTYTSGSFAQMIVRVTDLYGTHSYTIS